jgi:hypothetical protein
LDEDRRRRVGRAIFRAAILAGPVIGADDLWAETARERLEPVAGAGSCAVDAGYRGESLGSVKGTITNQMTTTPPSSEVLLVWDNSAGSPDRLVGEKVTAEGDFPARFTLDLYAPPPTEALNDYTHGGAYPEKSRVGVAYIVVYPVSETIDIEQAPIGGVEDYLLVYIETKVQPGTFSEVLLHGQLEAGYHLMQVKRLTPQEQAAADACLVEHGETFEAFVACGTTGGRFDEMYEAPQGFATEIPTRIVSDPDLLNFPNWT